MEFQRRRTKAISDSKIVVMVGDGASRDDSSSI